MEHLAPDRRYKPSNGASSKKRSTILRWLLTYCLMFLAAYHGDVFLAKQSFFIIDRCFMQMTVFCVCVLVI